MMMSSRGEQLSLAGTTRVIWFCACARYWPCRGVAGLHVVKCLVAWGTLGKRLTSGKVNFLHLYGSISMKQKVLGNCYKAKIIFTIIFVRGD